jgi:hypothetical protein
LPNKTKTKTKWCEAGPGRLFYNSWQPFLPGFDRLLASVWA